MIELAYEHGLDAVTTDMISKLAGISPRTFFNYFPYKEAALIPPPLSFPDDSVAKFIAGKGDLLDDMADLLSPVFDNLRDEKDLIRKSHQITASNPKLLALRNSAYHEFDTKIAELIKTRLGNPDEHGKALHMAALIAASIRVGFRSWIADDDGTPFENISEKIREIKHLFDDC
ncbi:MAG: TetR family transcriptional regulator [Paracoccaceae bacterium]